LEGGAGGDFLDGGAGLHDVADYALSNFGVTVNIGSGGAATGGHATGDTLVRIENLSGSNFGDTLSGNAAQNSLYGEGGSDTLNASNNNDQLFGGTGNDLLIGGAGADVIDGGDNDAAGDTASWANSAGLVTVSLALGTATGSGHGTGDTLTGIENVIGSAFNDKLTGDSNNNVLTGGDGLDVLTGGDGADQLIGQNGDDTLIGGLGADFLSGGGGLHDKADYSASNANITINLNVLAFGIGGHAQGDSWSGIEDVTGSNFGDTITGNNSANILLGGLGNDLLAGGVGADTLNGGSGLFDTADYTLSNGVVLIDLLAGTASGGHATGDTLIGIEVLYGSQFGDTLTGNNAVNNLLGGNGADIMNGNGGADTFIGGLGNDTMNGGAGNDMFVYDEGLFGQDTINGWVNGQDLIDVVDIGLTFADFTKTQSGADTLLTLTLDPAQSIRITNTLATTIDVTDFVA
jgi:Ca2+-binding RTX toxin-like protein